MKRYTKTKPLWLLIQGTDKKCATLIGVQHYLEDNNLKECKLTTIQDNVEVNHPLNNTVVRLATLA